MRRKQVLALLLSINMGVASAAPVVYAEDNTIDTYTTEMNTDNQPELPDHQDVSVPEEMAAADSQEEELSVEAQGDVSGSEIVWQDEELQLSDGMMEGIETSSSDRTTGSGEQINDFLQTEKISGKVIDGEIIIELVTGQSDYDVLYFGKRDEAGQEKAIKGQENELGGFTFHFAVTETLLGKQVSYVPGNLDNHTWYTDTILFLGIPEQLEQDRTTEAELVEETITEENIVPEADTVLTEEDEVFEETAVAADAADLPELVLEETDGDWLEADDIAEESAQALFLAAATETKDLQAVDNRTTLADGTYPVSSDQFTFSGGTGKMKITCTSVKVEEGKAYALLSFSSKSIQQVQWAGGSQDGSGIKQAEVPVALNTENVLGLLTNAMSEAHLVEYQIRITISEDTQQETESETDPVAQSEAEPETEKKPDTQSESEPDTGKKSEAALADGEYTVDPQKIELANGTKMFNIVACTLTVKDGKMTATMQLHGQGLDAMYLGNRDDAANSQSDWIMADTSGEWYTFTIPVPALDEVITYAARSKRDYAAKEYDKAWYKKELIFHKEGIKPKDPTEKDNKSGTSTGNNNGAKTGSENNNSGSNANSENNNTGNASSGNTNNGNTTGGNANSGNTSNGNTNSGNTNNGNANSGNTNNGSSNSGKTTGGKTGSGTTGGGTSGKTNTTSTSGSTGSKSTGAVDTATGLADGDYTPDSFSWSGGTGKLSISCDRIVVKGGQTYAVITFTSGKITYVKAGGSQFGPSAQTASSSTYEIPVQLNANNTIVACTTAMSQPHEIEYKLYIGLEAAKAGAAGDASGVSASNTSGSSAANGENSKNTENSSENAAETAKDGAELEKLDDAPKLAGLTYVGTEKNEQAQWFRIHQFEEDVKLIEIAVSESEPAWAKSENDSNEAASEEKKEETEQTETEKKEIQTEKAQLSADEEGSSADETEKSLYVDEVLRYLIVPEDADLPAGMDKELIVIQTPVEKTYVDSKMAIKMLEQLELTDKITLIGSTEEDEMAVSKTLKKLVEEETIKTAPHCDDVSVFKTLVTEHIGLAVVPGSVLEQEKKEGETKSLLQKMGDSLHLLSIPMIIDRTADEKEDAGKYEWVKVYGALYGAEEKAAEIYKAAFEALKKGDKS